MDRYERRVARGAAYLDSFRPKFDHPFTDWVDRLDLHALNVDHADRCVIGQLRLGGFNLAPEGLYPTLWLERRGLAVPGTNWRGLLFGYRGSRRFARRRGRLNAAWRNYVAAARERTREREAARG